MSPEDLELFRNKTAELLSSENPASKLFGSILNDAIDHIDSRAAQIEALKEKLIQERGKYIAVYEEDEWDFDDLPELDAREYIRTAHQQLKAEMPEVDWQ